MSELNLKTLIIKEIPAKIQRIYVNGTYPKGDKNQSDCL